MRSTQLFGSVRWEHANIITLCLYRSYSATCVSCATRWYPATCFRLWTSLGAWITSPVLSATRRWPRRPNSTNSTWSPSVRNVTIISPSSSRRGLRRTSTPPEAEVVGVDRPAEHPPKNKPTCLMRVVLSVPPTGYWHGILAFSSLD